MKRILILFALCCPVSAMALDIEGGVVVGPPGNKRPVNIMPVGLYRGGRGTHGHRQQFMPIGTYVRRHSNQLPCDQPRRFVHYVRPGGCIVYRHHRHI